MSHSSAMAAQQIVKGRVKGSSLMAEADRRRQRRGTVGNDLGSSSEEEDEGRTAVTAEGSSAASTSEAHLNLTLPPCYKVGCPWP